MLDLVGVQEAWWDLGGIEPAGEYTFLYGKGNENHELVCHIGDVDYFKVLLLLLFKSPKSGQKYEEGMKSICVCFCVLSHACGSTCFNVQKFCILPTQCIFL
jgi:hypothetical protein